MVIGSPVRRAAGHAASTSSPMPCVAAADGIDPTHQPNARRERSHGPLLRPDDGRGTGLRDRQATDSSNRGFTASKPEAFSHDANGRRYPPPFRLRRRRLVATGS
jgi:hypothetical protein